MRLRQVLWIPLVLTLAVASASAEPVVYQMTGTSDVGLVNAYFSCAACGAADVDFLADGLPDAGPGQGYWDPYDWSISPENQVWGVVGNYTVEVASGVMWLGGWTQGNDWWTFRGGSATLDMFAVMDSLPVNAPPLSQGLLTASLSNPDGSSGGQTSAQVTLTRVPEPGTLLLLGVSGAALLLRRRQRRNETLQ